MSPCSCVARRPADDGTPNPLAGNVAQIYTLAISQPARFMRDFVHLGFNQGPDDLRVFDGILQLDRWSQRGLLQLFGSHSPSERTGSASGGGIPSVSSRSRTRCCSIRRAVLAQAELATPADRIVLDMDSSESPVHGAQEGSAYNGHVASVCYHPLFLFTEHGDCLAATLRPGNVHSAEDWDDLLLPKIDRQQAEGKRVAFRADAAFAKPEIYDALETRDVDYAIRMPANRSLELEIEDILFRPPGRPSRKPLVRYTSFRYQAKSWTTPRRIVAKVEHHQGELFPRVGFIVTNMVLPSRSVVRFYNKRGTVEQWIQEGKQATHWTRLSCHRFRANAMRLQLSVLAYNLGNLWRRLVLPPRVTRWSLTSLQQRLVKTGGRLVKHARYYWLLLAEGHLTRRLFGDMLRRIWALPVPAG